MAKKRVLIFIDWFIPGFKAGGPISSNANLIDHLSDEIEFYVITRNTDYCETTPYPSVNSDAWNILPSGARVYYVSVSGLSFKSLIHSCRTIEFDTVFVNGIYSLYFSIFPLVWFKYFVKKPLIVSARGMLSEHTFSSKKLKKKLFYRIARLTGLYKGVIIHATNADEANQIRKNVGFRGTIRIAPNLPPKANPEALPVRQKTGGALHLISIARISPEKNTLFALQVLDQWVRLYHTPSDDPVPAIRLDLYGTAYDQDYWKQCESLIATLPARVKVLFHGPVEKQEIQEILNGSHFLLMPSQGENYGHSIVESLLTGCPVIISDRTPWQNLPEIGESGVGWDLPLENTDRFAEVLNRCLWMNQDAYNRMSECAYRYAQQITNDAEVLEASRRLFEL